MSTETQVFRISPKVNNYYETYVFTRSTGVYQNKLYYSSNKCRYVGKFIKHISTGYHDNATHVDEFNNNGNLEYVNYTYEGTTCFVQVFPDDIENK